MSFKKIISIFCVFVIMLSFIPNGVTNIFAVERVVTSSSQRPKDYVEENTFIQNDNEISNNVSVFSLKTEDEPKRVLLIEDNLPWRSQANQIVLNNLTEYKKVTTAQFLNEDLAKYSVIVFANDQKFSTYENYEAFKEYLEIFASIGGVIVFGACDGGWANGILNASIPGDVTKTNKYDHNNYIVDSEHPIVTGELTDGYVLQDEDLVSNYTSHIYFNESSLPVGTNVILRNSTNKMPTLIEYPLGKGRVIASGLTWEHSYNYKYSYEIGNFYKALDDLYSYAIRVSSIDVEELYLLDEWKVKANSHSIIVVEKGSDNNNLEIIPNAVVTVNGKNYTSDDNGQVFYSDNYGEQTVKISAANYREKIVTYNMKAKTSKIIFLEKLKTDGLPYIIQADTKYNDTNLSLIDEIAYFTENKDKSIGLNVSANWNLHNKGSYQIYQSAVNGKDGVCLNSKTGEFLFAPGKVFDVDRQIKLVAISADGVRSTPVNLNIKIQKDYSIKENHEKENNYIQEGSSNFDWIGNMPISSDNEIFTKLLTTDMSIKSDLIPIEISSTHNQDGSITYKGAIGFKKGEGTKNILHSKKLENDFEVDSAWAELKKQIKGYERAGNPKQYFENLKKKYGRDWHATKLRATVNAQVNACGFMEFTIGADGNVISFDGGVILDGGADTTIGRTFMAGPVPVYFEIKPEIKVETGMSLGMKFDDDGYKFAPDFKGISLQIPKLTLEGGVGVRGVATIGLQGSGSLDVSLLKDNKNTVDLNFGGAITVKVIFVVDYKWDFWNTKIPLWPQNNKNSISFMDVLDYDKAEVSLASRDYLNYETDWNGDVISPLLNSVNKSNITILKQGVLPELMPQIHEIDGKKVMLFIQDVSKREIGDHTQLVYSVCENGTWSKPEAVWETDTADYYFDSKVINNELYVAWQKSSTKVSCAGVEKILDEIAQNSEICFAKWGNNEFENQKYLTSNKSLDMIPKITDDGKNISVVWVSNDANDMIGTSGNNYIKFIENVSVENCVEKELFKTEDYILEFAPEYIDNKLQVVYTGVKNGEEKSSINIFRDNSSKEILNQNEATNIQVVQDEFIWQQDGEIHSYSPVTQQEKVIVDNNISSAFKYFKNNDLEAIVWKDNSNDETKNTSDLKAVFLNDNKWSDTITLDKLDFQVACMDLFLNENNEFEFVAGTSTYIDKKEQTSLVYGKISDFRDVEILYSQIDKADYKTNNQKLNIFVKNNGYKPVESIELIVSDDKNEYFNKIINVAINPAEIVYITEILDISNIKDITTANVKIIEKNDEDLSNNNSEIQLGNPDVKVSVETYDLNDKFVFSILMSNNSNTKTDLALKIKENTEDGILIDVKNIGEVSRDNANQYIYIIDKDQVDFINGFKTYFFEIQPSKEDWNEVDNVVKYTIQENINEDNLDINGNINEIKIIKPVSLEISKDYLNFNSNLDKSVQLYACITPENSSITDVEWSVENSDIVYIDSEGNVEPLRNGTTTITATLTDTIKDQITVTVGEEKEYSFEIKVDNGGVITGGNNKTYKRGDNVIISAKAKDGYVFKEWISSNSIDFKDKNSLETSFIMPENDVVIQAVFEEEIISPVLPKKIEIINSDIKFTDKNSRGVNLEIQITPSNAEYEKIIWISQDDKIVSIDENGFIQPINTGTTKIIARISDEIYDVITVTVGEEKLGVQTGDKSYLQVFVAFLSSSLLIILLLMFIKRKN